MTRAAITTGPFAIDVVPATRPNLGPGDVRLRVECVGICGTDLHIFDGSYPTGYPLVQGHEICGTVIEVGATVTNGLRPGDRVAVEPVTSCGHCRACQNGRRNTCQNMSAFGVHRSGGFQEELVAPASNCHPVGDLSATATALSETLSVSLRAVTRPSIGSGERVVVLGAGPIGLGVVLAATDLGARVLVIDQHEARLELARSLGAEETVTSLGTLDDRVRTWTDGAGADVVVEATGSPMVAVAGFHVVGTAGRVSLVGVSEEDLTVSLRLFTSKELDVYGSRATLDFPAAVALSQRHESAVSTLVTHRYGLAETGAALRNALDNPHSVVKTVIDIT